MTQPSYHVPLRYRGIMALGAVCFLAALIAGIWKMALTRGFLLPPVPEWLPPHGHLILGGFLGALIMFERMIGLRIDALVWVPYAYALSAVFISTGGWPVRAVHCVALLGWILHRYKAYATFHSLEKPLVEAVATIALSAALLFPGGLPARPEVALLALTFPVSAIAVERMELAMHFKRPGVRALLWGLIVWSFLWIACAWYNTPNLPQMGGLTLLLSAATAWFDTSLRTRKATSATGPLHGYMRVSLIVAYLWWFASGIAMSVWSFLPGAVAKDLVFHLMGLGFIFTMILAHAPIILASTLGKLPPEKAPWIPFVLFQTMLLLRISGDLMVTCNVPFWSWSGVISGAGHLVIFIAFVLIVFRSLRPLSPSLTNR